MNWLDSAKLGASLQFVGNTMVENENIADSVFINSCAVTEKADKESIKLAKHYSNLGKKVFVIGCSPKAKLSSWSDIKGKIKIFYDDKDLFKYFNISEDDFNIEDLKQRTRIPVAIQTGCDNLCTFCVTRIARGKTENFPEKSILHQINRCVDSGIREIVLTGIQLASWGSENSLKFPEQNKFAYLLNSIIKNTKIERIRLSSLGPQFLDNDFFEIIKNERICGHFHLSIQSGSESVLKKMNRGHDLEIVYKVINSIRKNKPKSAITADFIVGFPGESKVDFLDTVNMAEKIKFTKLHVFPFSGREGTAAKNFPIQVDQNIKKERARILRDIGLRTGKEFYENFIGQKIDFLIEDKTGISKNYIKIKAPYSKINTIEKIEITKENLILHKV